MIEPGYCQCGCGRKTWIATQDNPRWGHIKGQPVRFCSGHNAIKDVATRLWAKVDRRGPDDCWEWHGAHTPFGYGIISKDGRQTTAHRVAYELTYGPIPENQIVCHTCDNPPCCNPAHLWLGTDATNSDDKIAKGREGHPDNRGTRNPHARLTEADVLAIRRDHISGVPQRELARQYGVQFPAIWKIVTHRTWKHLP